MQQYSSKLVEKAVEQLNTLPGIGRKTALRLALHLLSKSVDDVHHFCTAIDDMRKNIIYCQCCCNISDTPICSICKNPIRDHTTICVVQNIADVISIENTNQYNGVYHVLGGIISPLDGIGPQDLNIDQLIKRVANGDVNEVILALSTTIEGDTTNYFIYRQLQPYNIVVSTLSRGVSIGDEIEYADSITLGRSIIDRTKFGVSSHE